MNDIPRLEAKVERFEGLLAAEARRYPEPDFAAELQMSSLRAQVETLREALRQAKAVREREVVELRFRRDDVAGDMPLVAFGKAAQYVGQALHAAAHHLRTGAGQGGPIPADLKALLDLRMVDLQPGSARVFVSGRLAPDLFGASLLEASLRYVFALLQADTDGALTDAVAALGLRSTRRLRDLLDGVSGDGFDLEIVWNAPGDTRKAWRGDRAAMRRLYRTLEQFDVSEPKRFTVTGTLYQVSLGGAFTVQGDGGTTYRGRFASKVESSIRALRVGQRVRARIEATTYVNDAIGAQRTSYRLVGIGAQEEA